MAELVLTSLEGFLSGTHLHLGGALSDGSVMKECDPQEAWRGLLAASALLNQFAPLMSHEVLVPYYNRLKALAQQLSEKYPHERFPAPPWLSDDARQTPVANLKAVAAEAWSELG
jgi:hypothetical protein